MTVRLAPASQGIAHRSIEKILETVLSDDDVELPSCVLIDEPAEDWRRHAALLPVEERRRSVIAASSDGSLMEAVRYEIGGALWLPASTPSMEVACEAASNRDRGPCAPIATRGVLQSLVAEAVDLWAVGWWPRSVWHRQEGSQRLFECLTDIAMRLGCVPAILPEAVLVVAGRGREAVEEACREAAVGSWGFVCPPDAVNLAGSLRPDTIAGRVEDLLVTVEERDRVEREGPPAALPVLEISTGEKIGRWSPRRDGLPGGRGWMASPSEAHPDGRYWDLVAEDGTRTEVAEIDSAFDQRPEDRTAVRVPGFIGAQLRRGSPAGLLVERWATQQARAGRPLWVPSADSEAVRFLLGLPGPIWVDGSGVPR